MYNNVPDERNIPLDIMPDDTVPVEVVDTRHGWRVYKSSGRVPSSATPPPVQNFISFVSNQPEYISQYYKDITFEISPQAIYHLLKEEVNLIFATDGGAVKLG